MRHVFLFKEVNSLVLNNGKILILISFISTCINKSKCSCACFVCINHFMHSIDHLMHSINHLMNLINHLMHSIDHAINYFMHLINYTQFEIFIIHFNPSHWRCMTVLL